MEKIIQITQTDIKKGEAGVPECCPVALALDRYGFKDVAVCCEDFYFTKRNGQRISVVLPKAVQNFIEKFDNRLDVKPFQFKLEIE